MKTKEELNALKDQVNDLRGKIAELNEDELKQVTGGDKSDIHFIFIRGAAKAGSQMRAESAVPER